MKNKNIKLVRILSLAEICFIGVSNKMEPEETISMMLSYVQTFPEKEQEAINGLWALEVDLDEFFKKKIKKRQEQWK